MRFVLAFAIVAGCSPGGSPGIEPWIEAGCEVDPENALRLSCEVVQSPAGPASITVHDPLAPRDRTFSDATVATHHTFRVWGLHAETAIGWTASAGGRSLAGETSTGAVPANLGEPPIIEVSADHRTEALVIQRACEEVPTLAMVDDSGNFLWYAPIGELYPSAGILGFSLTDDGVVALLGREVVIEVGFDGATRQVLQTGNQLATFVHHDVVVSPDRFTYVLTADSAIDSDGDEYVLDGIDVFDPAGTLVTRWKLGPPFDPELATPIQIGYWAREFGMIPDASHANALFHVDEDTVLMSLRHLSSVVAVEGLREGQGHVAWVVGADPPALPSDYTWGEGIGFEFQHHIVQLDDGTYTVLDNRATPSGTRGLRFALDPATMTADELAEWPVGEWCPVQGSAALLPDDHLLIGCAGSREAIEVSDAGEIVWRMRNSCDAIDDNGLVRALPLVLGDVAISGGVP